MSPSQVEYARDDLRQHHDEDADAEHPRREGKDDIQIVEHVVTSLMARLPALMRLAPTRKKRNLPFAKSIDRHFSCVDTSGEVSASPPRDPTTMDEQFLRRVKNVIANHEGRRAP